MKRAAHYTFLKKGLASTRQRLWTRGAPIWRCLLIPELEGGEHQTHGPMLLRFSSCSICCDAYIICSRCWDWRKLPAANSDKNEKEPRTCTWHSWFASSFCCPLIVWWHPGTDRCESPSVNCWKRKKIEHSVWLSLAFWKTQHSWTIFLPFDQSVGELGGCPTFGTDDVLSISFLVVFAETLLAERVAAVQESRVLKQEHHKHLDKSRVCIWVEHVRSLLSRRWFWDWRSLTSKRSKQIGQDRRSSASFSMPNCAGFVSSVLVPLIWNQFKAVAFPWSVLLQGVFVFHRLHASQVRSGWQNFLKSFGLSIQISAGLSVRNLTFSRGLFSFPAKLRGSRSNFG